MAGTVFNGDNLMAKNQNVLAFASMYITKASLSPNGIMKWAATNSDTDPDSYNERMSPELYQEFCDHIKNEDELPVEFKPVVCSDYWCGGMPYLSISHYPDMNGKAVPGEPLELFVDGKKLKAKGVLFDNPLGHSVWRSLKEDKYKSTDEKIRISIGFLDLAHRHGDGDVWVRENLYSLCPECLHGVENKVYVKGYLVHLALTRVPVNKRTEMVLEEKSDMAKKTRKEDAESIIGKELAEELEAKQKISVQRSNALIEMAETTAPAVEPKTEEEIPVSEEVPEKVVARVEEVEVTKSDDAMDTVMTAPSAVVDSLPYGGATSMKDAEKFVSMQNETIFVMDAWNVLTNVAWNIFERNDIPDKKVALNGAVDEFRNMLAAKSMVAFAALSTVVENDHVLKPALDALLANIDNTLTMESDVNDKLATINPSLQELGNKILEYVTAKSQFKEKPVPPEDKNKETLLAELKSIVQPLADAVTNLQGDVGILKSQINAKSVETKSRIPQPRTFTSSIYKSQEVEQPKPGSLRAIVNKSVEL